MRINRVLAIGAALFTALSSVNAALVASGRLDGVTLLTDTATGLQWLSPVATTGQSYLSIAGGYRNFVTSGGFQIATLAQIETMFKSNFDPAGAVPSRP